MLNKKKILILNIFLNKFFNPNNYKKIIPVIKDKIIIASLNDEEKIM